MSTLDDNLLDTLTDEERAAMADDDLDESTRGAMEKIAGEAGDDDDDDVAGGGAAAAPAAADPPAAGEPAAVATPSAGEPAAGAHGAEPDELETQAFAPQYRAQLPSDYDAQIQAIRERDTELRQRFKDGEIDIDERDLGLSALNETREQLLVSRAKSEVSAEMNEQAAQSAWQSAINTFVRTAAKDGGIDYRKDAAKAADWDQFVRVLAAKEEHSDKPMDWFLAEAHKRVLALHGVAAAKPTADEAIAAAKAKRQPPTAAAPKTLAQVPGGDGPGDVEGEFSSVLALDGQDYEDAIAAMSPAQRAKFMRDN